MNDPTYSVALIGLGNMSRGHVKQLLAQSRLRIVGGCDPSASAREAFDAGEGVELFEEVAPMMEKWHPDLVVIVAPDAVHASLTKQVAAYAPKAILCEKPMAVSYADAVDMVETCEAKGVELLINHQRRLVIEPYVRKLIDDGTLGDLLECEARCAGDMIGDGTHAVDSLMAIGGDLSPETVWGMIDLGTIENQKETRYGRAKEQAAAAFWFTNHIRYSVQTGKLAERIPYQSYRIRGCKAELWHPGGKSQPALYVNDGKPGTHKAALQEDGWFFMPEPQEGGPWRCINLDVLNINPMGISLDLLIKKLDGDPTPHPLNGRRSLKVQEIINAVYQSAQDQKAITLPLSADI